MTLTDIAEATRRAGRGIALAGVVLTLLLIGRLKFTAIEVAALEGLIGPTPWLAWLYGVFGREGTSYFLGVTEIATVLLLVASPWSARAGVAGGFVGAGTFAVTSSLMLSLTVWEPSAPVALNGLGSFLIKDVAFVGISLTVLGESLGRLAQEG